MISAVSAKAGDTEEEGEGVSVKMPAGALPQHRPRGRWSLYDLRGLAWT